MSEGNALQIATPKELYNRPVSVEVADFIGQMNFIEASVTDLAHGQATLETAGLGTLTAPASGEFIQRGERIVVAIRPEKLSLSQAENGRVGVPGVMKTAAYLGDRRHFYVAVDGCENPLAVAAPGSTMDVSTDFDRNSTVWVSWSEESLVLLPRE